MHGEDFGGDDGGVLGVDGELELPEAGVEAVEGVDALGDGEDEAGAEVAQRGVCRGADAGAAEGARQVLAHAPREGQDEEGEDDQLQ